jgi:NAD/NADP transhydrogenase alpha subunit
MAKWVSESDIVITTALIPGRPAPKLISATMLEGMKPGSGTLSGYTVCTGYGVTTGSTVYTVYGVITGSTVYTVYRVTTGSSVNWCSVDIEDCN